MVAPFTHIIRIYEHEQRAYVCSYISNENIKNFGGECDGKFQYCELHTCTCTHMHTHTLLSLHPLRLDHSHVAYIVADIVHKIIIQLRLCTSVPLNFIQAVAKCT